MGQSKAESSNPNPKKTEHHLGDSDIVSFWLLLLFVAVFFGIAAEEARRPMFISATNNPFSSSSSEVPANKHADAVRSLDLLSVEQERVTGPIGRRGEKSEAPATGK
jgi:hypothetical protein